MYRTRKTFSVRTTIVYQFSDSHSQKILFMIISNDGRKIK